MRRCPKVRYLGMLLTAVKRPRKGFGRATMRRRATIPIGQGLASLRPRMVGGWIIPMGIARSTPT